jgi:hypothetical protein
MAFSTFYVQPAPEKRTILSPGYPQGLELPYTAKLGTVDSYLGNIVLGVRPLTVVGQIINESVTSTLTLTGMAGNAIFNVADNTLTITNTVSAAGSIYNRSLTDTLTMTHSLTTSGSEFNRSVSNTLSFVTTMTYLRTRFYELDNTLVFTLNEVLRIYGLQNNLLIYQDAQITGFGKVSNNTLAFTNTVSTAGSTFNRSLTNTLTFTNTVSAAGSTYNRSVSNTLTLSQSVSVVRVRFATANNTLTLTNNVIRVIPITVTNTLALTQTLAKQQFYQRTLTNTLALTQILSRQLIVSRSLAQTLELAQGGPRVLDFGLQYSFPAVLFSTSSNFVMQGFHSAISLPNPMFGDSEALNAKLDVKKAINGTTYTYKRRTTSKILRFNFEVDYKKAEEMREFTYNNSGKPIQLTTWEGHIWVGYLVTNPLVIKGISIAGSCSERRQFDFEFEGVRIH